MIEEHRPEPNRDVKIAAQLSITEISLGSIGHGLKIPLTGHVLSLNQLAFLLNVINKYQMPKAAVFEISTIAAILKSLSPAGQKLGPMLSIAMQGFLFWLSITFFGSNFVGQIIGALLLSLWAFIQPFITLFFIYGFDFFKLIQFYKEKINNDYSFIALALIYALILIVIIKLILAVSLVIFSKSLKKEINFVSSDKVKNLLNKQVDFKLSETPVKSAFKDLFKPLFLLSFILMLIFIWQINGNFSYKIWLGLRPLATAFIIFYLIRSPWVSQKFFELSKKSKYFERLYLKAKAALDYLKND